jgi:hypothetical protein
MAASKRPSNAPKTPTKAPKAPTKAPTATANAYSIQLDLTGIPVADDRAIFAQAVAKWESVIIGDVSNYNTRGLPTESGCALPAVIDDMFICARFDAIDGRSNVLGYASPEYVRYPGTMLPVNGYMVFDDADVPYMRTGGNFMNTIMHEMGHVLGTFWLSSWSRAMVSCSYTVLWFG